MILGEWWIDGEGPDESWGVSGHGSVRSTKTNTVDERERISIYIYLISLCILYISRVWICIYIYIQYPSIEISWYLILGLHHPNWTSLSSLAHKEDTMEEMQGIPGSIPPSTLSHAWDSWIHGWLYYFMHTQQAEALEAFAVVEVSQKALSDWPKADIL